MELLNGIVTPGWSDPKIDKLPYFGLPADMTGMRVLDIGNAEGFFPFEAERRGAAEVTGIENYPPMARKFENLPGRTRVTGAHLHGECVRSQSQQHGNLRSCYVLRSSLSSSPSYSSVAKDRFGMHRHGSHADCYLR